jgi:CubicO group peptidase (beta-lactamase class C family)
MAMSIQEARPSALAAITPERIAKLNRYLKSCVDDGYFAGVTSAVMQRGKVLQNEAFGYRDGEDKAPMTTDTVFRIASSTKPIIGVALMQLYEQGKWKLTDRLDQHIPEFKALKVRDGEKLVDMVQPQTMAHIMSHSAGLGGAQLVARGSDEPVPRERPKDLDAMIAQMAQRPLAFQPGKRFLYGPSVDVQAYLVQKFSGMRVDDYLQKYVTGPLGMKDTDFCVHEDAKSRAASMYKYAGGKLERTNKPDPDFITKRPSFLSGSGGLWSSPEDYRRFCAMLLGEGAYDGVRILKPETVRLMRQDLLEPQVFVRVVAGYTMPGARFGCDFMVITEPQGDTAMYGKDSFSWGGAFGTYFWIDPTNEIAVSGMVQIANGGAQHLGAKTEYPDLKRNSAQLLYWGEIRI